MNGPSAFQICRRLPDAPRRTASALTQYWLLMRSLGDEQRKPAMRRDTRSTGYSFVLVRGFQLDNSIPRVIFLATLALPFSSSCMKAQSPTKIEIGKRGKEATALVEIVERRASGSAFCIEESGLFVTNEHVVHGAVGNTVNLVINSGTGKQKVLKARVVRRAEVLDLALLKVEEKVKLPTLTVGKTEKIAELTELIAVGFPFGKDLALEKDKYPAITVNRVSVSSLREKDGRLERLQLDGPLNPGHSGAPVLDHDGKVAGVIVSGYRGSGVSFAIPAEHITAFLAQKDLRRLEGHRGVVYSAAFAPDGKTLASASSDGTVRLWDWPAGKLRQTLEPQKGEMVLATYSPDGKTLVCTTRDRVVIAWDALTGKQRWTTADHEGIVIAAVFSPDGKILATTANDCNVKLRDPATGQVRTTLRGHKGHMGALTFFGNAKTLVSSGGHWESPQNSGEVKVWDVETGVERKSVSGEFGGVWGLALSPDEKTLAGACLDKTVRLWDTTTWKERAVLRGHTDRVIWVAFSPKDDLLASSSHDKTVRLWNATDGKGRGVLHGHSAQVDRLAFSPDGKVLASTSYDTTIGLWEMSDWKP
jgi:WD40 repeat protein